MVVADTMADWSTAGTQGEKGWTYGYYNKTADASDSRGIRHELIEKLLRATRPTELQGR